MTMKYLVTGADGFLGQHLLQLLHDNGVSVRAMLQEDFGQTLPGDPQRVVADLSDPASLLKATEGVTHVVHLAARVHQMNDDAEDPIQAFREVNVEGTRRLLDACEANNVEAFLLMSSVKAMCETSQGILDETTECRPMTPYGISKLEAEHVVEEWNARTKTRCVTLRLPMVYGPGAKGNVLTLLRKAKSGKRLPFGGIRNKRSMVYVGNVVDAICRTMETPEANGVYIVSDEQDYSTKELYETMGREAGAAKPTFYFPILGLKLLGLIGSVAGAVLKRPMPIDGDAVSRLTEDLCFSSEKLRQELDITPPFNLESGMAETVKWYLALD
jgi:nucleoside-diphosphate-sugar epimerase